MDYRTILIELGALLLLYYLLHSDNMAILNACENEKESCNPHAKDPDHMTEEDRVIADAIFGSIAAPLFSAKMGASQRASPRASAHVEEVPEEKAESPNASQTTGASAVRRRTPKKATTDVPTT
jgi:hypothetical protein